MTTLQEINDEKLVVSLADLKKDDELLKQIQTRLHALEPDEDEPLIAMDEASKQLLGHLYPPIPMQPGQDKKEDYHYTREG